MIVKGINSSKCSGCSKCVTHCVARLYTKASPSDASGSIVYKGNGGSCIECGHCVAVCPSDAIDYDLQEDRFLYNASGEVPEKPESADFFRFLAGKRSVRRYKDKDVPKEEIEKVLEAMRYAPTGHNAQHCRHVVVKDRKVISLIIDEAIKMMKGMTAAIRWRYLLKPFISERIFKSLNSPSAREGISAMIDEWESGKKDPVTFNTPVLILTYTPALGNIGSTDAVIADTYGMLAADTMGLGTCWMGFIMMAMEKNRKFKKQFGIPMDMNLMGAFTLGYSAARYEAIPPRKQAKVTWV